MCGLRDWHVWKLNRTKSEIFEALIWARRRQTFVDTESRLPKLEWHLFFFWIYRSFVSTKGERKKNVVPFVCSGSSGQTAPNLLRIVEIRVHCGWLELPLVHTRDHCFVA